MGRPDDDDEFDDDEFEEEEEWEEDDELEEDEEEFEEVEEEDSEEIPEVPSESQAPPAKSTASEEAIQTEPVGVVSVDSIPIHLSIEIGRLKMSAKQLLSLQPGSMIEVDVDPEAGLDLVANGACIGKGELIKVGQALGVRVLEMG